jgi:AGZA family xanthine/uracil permease-like MFS transporter
MVTAILSMLIVDVFDTAGTLVGVATRADLLGDDGKLPRLRRALLSDSTATVVGALSGTSSTTSYIESAAGVEAGGRTGLTAVVCGLLFLACLFFAPLAQSVPAYATASALLFVACLMARSLADIDWQDVTESAPAVVAAIAMPLSFSIAEGIGLGFITYVKSAGLFCCIVSHRRDLRSQIRFPVKKITQDFNFARWGGLLQFQMTPV